MSCNKICELEINRIHDDSISNIKPQEFICRATYEHHFSEDRSVLYKSIIDRDDLLNDSLSFWRVADIQQQTLNQVKKKILQYDRARRPIITICHPMIKEIRELKVTGYEGRVFHVLDDCKATDGKIDNDHCTVGICKKNKKKIECVKKESRSIRDVFFKILIQNMTPPMPLRSTQRN